MDQQQEGGLYQGMNKRAAILSKAQLLNVHNKCWYCGLEFGKGVEKHLDHIIPKSRGGSDHISNLAVVCSFCNYAKHDLDLLQYLSWLSHIRCSSFSCYILDKIKIKIECGMSDKLKKGYY
jgi:5-methylcytosine-specific restriction endonuclease McrA